MAVDVQRFLADVLTWQGVPFHHQGRGRAGVDCVGLALVGLAAQGVLVDVPADYSTDAAGQAMLDRIERTGLLQALPSGTGHQAGDVLVFRVRREPQHMGIALAADRMLHVTSPGGVCSVTLSPQWRDRVVAQYRWTDG